MKVIDGVINRLDELLTEKKMTKPELAIKGELPYASVISIYKKLGTSISLNTLRSICKGLGMTMSEFLNSGYFSEEWLNLKPDPDNPTKPNPVQDEKAAKDVKNEKD